ncbi:MAG: M20/M25/M40 family metallo-hydrolase, partial [Pseudomonadota bacterium]
MTTPAANMKINADRLWDSLMEMAKIGPGIAGGNNRQTLTDEDGEGRKLFQDWCEAAGCSMGVDAIGNMFATRPGEDPDALPVYVGSHLDTQPTGGKYDGVLGVLGGLELIRTLNDLNVKTKHPIVVTNWTNEEGTRFAPAMLASGVFAGVHTQEWCEDRTDADGRRFGDELDRIGWRGDEAVGLWLHAISSTSSSTRAMPRPAFLRIGMGVEPVWLSLPSIVTCVQERPCPWVTTPISTSSASRIGPCSMCSSKKARILRSPTASSPRQPMRSSSSPNRLPSA